MLMLSKYAVPESEKGYGIMSTSTSPSRIRQKLLIPGAFAAEVSLCVDMSLQATDMTEIKGRGDAIIRAAARRLGQKK